MKQTFDVVIVGGGHGSAQAAIALRRSKYSGTIAIIGEEADLSYERLHFRRTVSRATRSSIAS